MKTKEIGLPKDRTKWTNGEWATYELGKKECEGCVLGKNEVEAFKRGKLATLKGIFVDFEKWINHEEGYEAGFREIIKAKIKEAEK